MGEIVVKEKPCDISWDEIHDVLWAAHAENRKAGLNMKAPCLPGSQMEALVGENGHCFVALDGEKVIGTCSFKIETRNNWYVHQQPIAYCMLAGILPEYRGKGVYSQLLSLREQHIRQLHIKLMEMNTAEHNTAVQEALLKKGWRRVDFISLKSPHYSVVMAKWLDGCPYSTWKCWWKYTICKWKVKIKYKPGYIKRFG